jgi:hypothetical protein
MNKIVVETAVSENVPGCSDRSLYDARPHLQTIVQALYMNGYALCRLIDSPKGKAIAESLSGGKTVTIK